MVDRSPERQMIRYSLPAGRKALSITHQQCAKIQKVMWLDCKKRFNSW